MVNKKRSSPWEDKTDKEVAVEYYKIATKGRGKLFRLYTWLAVVLPEYVKEIGLPFLYLLAFIAGAAIGTIM